MPETQLARICSKHARLVSLNRLLNSYFLVGATFLPVFNPGYNQGLSRRARVLLAGQTFGEYFNSA